MAALLLSNQRCPMFSMLADSMQANWQVVHVLRELRHC